MAERSRSQPRPRPAAFLRFPTVAIYCGSEIPVDYDQHRPGNLQILPEELEPLDIATGPPAKARSNGCGMAVHGGVCMTRRGREQCWYSWTDDVAPTVVPLETRYFPPVVAEMLGLRIEDAGRNDCGGNPLGTLQTFCTAHAPRTVRRAVYLFLASAVSPPPQTPSARQVEPSMDMSRILQTLTHPTPTSPLGSIPPSLPAPPPVVPRPERAGVETTLAPTWAVQHMRPQDFSAGDSGWLDYDSDEDGFPNHAPSREFERVHNSQQLVNARQSRAQPRTPNPIQGNTVSISLEPHRQAGSVDGPGGADEQDQQIERSFLAAISVQRMRDAGWHRSLDQLDDLARLIAELEPPQATTAARGPRMFFNR
ncbi:hypothetical protein B0H11DRAFT_2234026 [Mycena galericulata]|nr:hypothetical protein B0H11DRAFT_2234026 [Mycena galericulata]